MNLSDIISLKRSPLDETNYANFIKTGPAISTPQAKMEHQVSRDIKNSGLSKTDGKNNKNKTKARTISLLFQTTFYHKVRFLTR